MSAKSELRVGIMSDTHGLLRAEARAFLSGCDYIIHGGDVGGAAVLEDLEALAPVIAVRGNNDSESWAKRLRETELIRLGGVFVYVIHDLSQLDIDPAALGIRAGHLGSFAQAVARGAGGHPVHQSRQLRTETIQIAGLHRRAAG